MGVVFILMFVIILVCYFISMINEKATDIGFTIALFVSIFSMINGVYIYRDNIANEQVLHAISVDNLQPVMEYKVLDGDTTETTYHYIVDGIKVEIKK